MTRLYTIQLSATELTDIWDRTVGSREDEALSDSTESLFVKIDEAQILKKADEGTAVVLRATKEQLRELQEKLNELFKED